MKTQLSLLVYVALLGLYTYGIWQCAKYIIPTEQEIEIKDLEIRLENCHWQLLIKNAEIETLTKKIDG